MIEINLKYYIQYNMCVRVCGHMGLCVHHCTYMQSCMCIHNHI